MDETLEAEVLALRACAALTEMRQVSALSVRGEDAFDALDMLVAAELFVRDGQMLHSLILNPDGEPLADVYVCCDDEDFIILAEGMTAAQLIEHAQRYLPAGLDVSFEDLDRSHQLVSLNGPYCWEVLSDWMGPDIIGIPFFTFFHLDAAELIVGVSKRESLGVCFRAGKTGEFGYDLLIRREHVASVVEGLGQVGEPLGLVRVGLAALDVCALENGFFNIRRADWKGLTPIELQLQWRVSYRKEYVGADALRARRVRGAEVRTTQFVATGAVTPGEEVLLQGERLGVIHAAAYSPVRRDWVGLALLSRRHAHAGIDGLTVQHGDESVSLRTVSAPVINNRSLYVDPRRHSARYGDDESFPPLVV